MDVVSSEARCGLPSELLYADDLVIMAPTMEQLGRRVAEKEDFHDRSKWRRNMNVMKRKSNPIGKRTINR